jgi:hypothetical protein
MLAACGNSSSDSDSSEESSVTYPVTDSGQTLCYGVDITSGETGEIDCPAEGEELYGQDAQFSNHPIDLTLNDDGVTTSDNVTGLMWQTTPPTTGGDEETGFYFLSQAETYCSELELGEYDDWRVPTVKELYSISDFGSGWPYLSDYDEETGEGYFVMIDSTDKSEQYWGQTYVGHTEEGGYDAALGVNHVTGHIKAYPSGDGEIIIDDDADVDVDTDADADEDTVAVDAPDDMPSGPMSQGKRIRCVRGGDSDDDGVVDYAINNFVNNDDDTVSDQATGLMWQQSDNGGATMNWKAALAFAETATTGGYDDWRLPSVKELQSIVDYTRSPTAQYDSEVGPAIDTDFFTLTPVDHDLTTTYDLYGNEDYGYYWTSTSAYFGSENPEYYFAWYVAFGSAVDGEGNDYHGAGAVRFDTKKEYDSDTNITAGDPERVDNYVLLVRDIE